MVHILHQPDLVLHKHNSLQAEIEQTLTEETEAFMNHTQLTGRIKSQNNVFKLVELLKEKM